MLSFESFVHREELAGLITRWMLNRPRPDDVHELKKIVNFNLYMARIWIDLLARDLLGTLHGKALEYHLVRSKGGLKDRIVDHPDYTNAKIEERIAQYRRYPEDYYLDTPYDGGFYTVAGGDGGLVGCTRIKRFRRIAEKGSRRIVDFLFRLIQDDAEALAGERARELGVTQAELRTTPEQMLDEFARAERRVLESIKQGTILGELPRIRIPDVVGMKLIDEDPEIERLREALDANDACTVLEEERHTGRYNATNFHVAFRLPRAELADRPPSGRFLELLQFRGIDPERVHPLYREFLAAAEETVTVEIIVSTFEEFLESEIGRSMHEEHILDQRAHPEYTGHLATNVRYLMDFMLTLCRGPACEELDEVPIRLWVKYMPDTIVQLARRIFLSDELFFDTIS